MSTVLLPSGPAGQAPASRGPALMMLGWLLITMAWWALAFFPADAAAPTWLVRVQAICFGRAQDGLPEAYGWIVLVATPVSLLAGLLVTYATELRQEWSNLRTRPWFWAAALVLVPVVVAEVVYITDRVVEGRRVARTPFAFSAAEPLPENYPRTDRPAERFSLIDQSGDRLSLESFRGKKLVLTFAFAHCHTMCPTIVRNTVEALETLPAEHVSAVIVTLDPWRDTPSSLPTLAQAWKMPTHAHVVSGEVAEVTDVLERYRMPFERDKATGDIAHPALLYVVDRNGDIAYTLNEPTVATIRDAVSRVE